MIKDIIIGHQQQRQFLRNSIKMNRIAHAYLFKGEEYLGKKKVALEFIKILNCKLSNIDQRPCGSCIFCQQFKNVHNPDLFLIKPDGQEIKIGQIRDLIQKINLKSYSLKYKVVIIDRAEKLNKEAANALLKVLEEPPKNSIFILISAYLHSLPPTVISRTQIIDFFLLNKEEIKQFIDFKNKKKNKISNQDIADIIFFSNLKPDKVIYFLKNKQKLKNIKEDFLKIEQGFFFDLIYSFEYIKKISQKDNKKIEQFLANLLFYFRFLLVGTVREYSQNFSLKQITEILDYIQRVEFLIRSTNVNTKLALENLLLLLALHKIE